MKIVNERKEPILIMTGIILLLIASGVLFSLNREMGAKTTGNITVGPCESSPGEGYPSCGSTITFRVMSPKNLERSAYDGNTITFIGTFDGSPNSVCVRQVTLLKKPTSEKIPIVIIQKDTQNGIKIRYFDVNKCALVLPTGKKLR